jgi:hypothetical protein
MAFRRNFLLVAEPNRVQLDLHRPKNVTFQNPKLGIKMTVVQQQLRSPGRSEGAHNADGNVDGSHRLLHRKSAGMLGVSTTYERLSGNVSNCSYKTPM